MTNGNQDGPSPEQIGERIARIVRDVGEAQGDARGWKGELAECMGVSASYITKMLRDPPPRSSERMMDSVCRRLGILPEYFTVSDEELSSFPGDLFYGGRPWERYLVKLISRYHEPLDEVMHAVAAVDGVKARTPGDLKGLTWAAARLNETLRALPIVAEHERSSMDFRTLGERLRGNGPPLQDWEREELRESAERIKFAAEELAWLVRNGLPKLRTQPPEIEAFDRLAKVEWRSRAVVGAFGDDPSA